MAAEQGLDDETNAPEPAFKAKVALVAVKGEKTLAELAQQFDFTRIRSRRGAASGWKRPRGFSDRKAIASRPSQRST